MMSEHVLLRPPVRSIYLWTAFPPADQIAALFTSLLLFQGQLSRLRLDEHGKGRSNPYEQYERTKCSAEGWTGDKEVLSLT